MANKTIYPYGVGGQLPSGIAVVNDFTTGGADNALSAEMGKTLRQTIIPMLTATPNSAPLNLSETADFEKGSLTTRTGAEASSNTAIRSVFIPVYPGTTVVCTAQKSLKVFEYKENKNYNGEAASWGTSLSYDTKDDSFFIRIVVSGGESLPVWGDIHLSVIPSSIFRFIPYADEAVEKFAAIKGVPNTTPLPLVESDFESGTLSNGTGKETSSSNVIRTKDFWQIFPGTKINFSTSDGSAKIFEFDEEKRYVNESGFESGSSSFQTSKEGFYIRVLVYKSGGVVWNDAQLSVTPEQAYQYVRAVSPDSIEEMIQADLDSYADLEIPVLAPAPQLPANTEPTSDFNAETLTSTEIQSAIEAIISKTLVPNVRLSYAPAYCNIYDVIGRDATNQYDIKAYVFTRRNRYCYRAAGALYAWKLGATTLYTAHRSPRIGDTVYSDSSWTDSGYTVTAYDSSGPEISVNGNAYTRDDSAKIPADDIYMKQWLTTSMNSTTVYDKAGNSLGTATKSSATSLSFSGKTYARYQSLDFHSENKATIVLWGNEHGPQSDPNEPSILLYRLAKDLCDCGRGNPFLTFLRAYCKVVIIPAANPWGMNAWADSGTEGRNNGNNVNINANYDTPGWVLHDSSVKGAYAGSEPETQFIMNTVLDIEPDIAIDIHCLGYTAGVSNEGLCHYDGQVPGVASDFVPVMTNYCGLYLTSYGTAHPDTSAYGDDWINSIGVHGGLIEMNGGAKANSYDGKQHTAPIMFADYTLLLNMIRMWYYEFDPTLDLRKLGIK